MPASSRRIPRRLVTLVVSLLLGAPLPAAAFRAADGTRIFHAAADARVAVVGVVGEPRRLDQSGRVASLAVNRELLGAGRVPEDLQIAWEELSASREDRFQKGERVLVILAPLPSGSLWAKRFSTAAERARTRHVAEQGKAFVRRPSTGGIDLLFHYWSLPAVNRRGPDGLRHLAALCEGAELPLAVSAALWLPSIEDPEASTTVPVAGLLADALLRPDAGGRLQTALLEWFARAQPMALRDTLAGRVAATDPPLPVLVWALAHVQGKLPEQDKETLLASADPALRAAAVGHAGEAQLGTLSALATGDPEPRVRAAAATRAALLGAGGFEVALSAFTDSEPLVRSAAARAAASSPALDTSRLRDVLFDWPRPASETALVTLRLAGTPEARAAVEEAARDHPDEGIRGLARLSIGEDVGPDKH